VANRKYQQGFVSLVHSGEEYFAELEKIIHKASDVIYLQTYIFDEDDTGKRILEALKAASDREVRVYLRVDGFGSYRLGREFMKQMRDYGIFFRHFSPLPFPGITQAGRRLHVKVCVVDGLYALIGGINISDRYRGVNGELPWLDYALSVEGPVCSEIELVCMQIWRRRFMRPESRTVRKYERKDYPVRVKVSVNDWFRRRNQISVGYKRMLKRSKKEIIIIASYFLPGKKMLNSLMAAVRKGRKVSVILSRQSDVPLVKHAINYLYPKLLREGVTIYEYETAILHAKACVIDDHWLSLGSHNLNNLSEFLSVEMNLEVLDDKFAGKFADELRDLIANECRLVNADEFKESLNIFIKFRWWLAYNILALIQRILYIFFKRETFPGKLKQQRVAE
jgi:cardiolipin synthase